MCPVLLNMSAYNTIFISEHTNLCFDVVCHTLESIRNLSSCCNTHSRTVCDEETGDETDEVLLDADGEPFRADAIVVDGTSILNLTTKQGLIEFSKKRNKVRF